MSLFICPTHGLHHGPFCCDEPQTWWDGTFSEPEDAQVDRSPQGQDAQRFDRNDESAVPEGNASND